MREVITKSGMVLEATFIKQYGLRKLWLCQDRLMLTDLANKEIRSMDVLDFVLMLGD